MRVRAAQGRAELEAAQVVLEELVVAGAQQLHPAATAARLAHEGAKEREALRVRTSLRLRTPLRVGTSCSRRRHDDRKRGDDDGKPGRGAGRELCAPLLGRPICLALLALHGDRASRVRVVASTGRLRARRPLRHGPGHPQHLCSNLQDPVNRPPRIAFLAGHRIAFFAGHRRAHVREALRCGILRPPLGAGGCVPQDQANLGLGLLVLVVNGRVIEGDDVIRPVAGAGASSRIVAVGRRVR